MGYMSTTESFHTFSTVEFQWKISGFSISTRPIRAWKWKEIHAGKGKARLMDRVNAAKDNAKGEQ